jgi:Domain of unknown function (DUF3504)
MTKQQVPDNTRRKAQWVVNLYNQWATEVTNSGTDQEIADMLSTDLLHQSYHNLNMILCNFVLSLRRKDGNEYTSGTLFSIITSMQKYFEIHGRPISFLNDPNFNELKNCLDNSMHKFTKEGYGLQKRQANVITKKQENELWERGILGIDEPEKLLHSMFWTVGVNFGLRGGDEHRNLTRENFRVMVDQDGKKYLEYKESISKTYKGGLKHRKTEPHQARAYEIPDSPRCPVQMFALYTSKLNPASSKSAFYFQPLSKPTEEVWFALAPVGHNKLKEVVKSIMLKGGYDGYFTNHSLRATTATRLFEQKVPEQLIMEQTGHRSTAIYSYKRPSDAQKRDVSQALQATTSKSSDDNNNIINNNNGITNNNNTKNNEVVDTKVFHIHSSEVHFHM